MLKTCAALFKQMYFKSVVNNYEAVVPGRAGGMSSKLRGRAGGWRGAGAAARPPMRPQSPGRGSSLAPREPRPPSRSPHRSPPPPPPPPPPPRSRSATTVSIILEQQVFEPRSWVWPTSHYCPQPTKHWKERAIGTLTECNAYEYERLTNYNTHQLRIQTRLDHLTTYHLIFGTGHTSRAIVNIHTITTFYHHSYYHQLSYFCMLLFLGLNKKRALLWILNAFQVWQRNYLLPVRPCKMKRQ